jgi:hypothetical protein
MSNVAHQSHRLDTQLQIVPSLFTVERTAGRAASQLRRAERQKHFAKQHIRCLNLTESKKTLAHAKHLQEKAKKTICRQRFISFSFFFRVRQRSVQRALARIGYINAKRFVPACTPAALNTALGSRLLRVHFFQIVAAIQFDNFGAHVNVAQLQYKLWHILYFIQGYLNHFMQLFTFLFPHIRVDSESLGSKFFFFFFFFSDL